jgi:hypothetical protein
MTSTSSVTIAVSAMVELLELDQDDIFAFHTAAAAGMKGLAVALAKLINERQVAQFRRPSQYAAKGCHDLQGRHDFRTNTFQRFYRITERF